MEKTQKSTKIAAAIFLILGSVGIIAGIGIMVYNGALRQEQALSGNAVEVFDARKEEEDVYAWVQYMSDSVAYYESMENMQFYIVFDSEFNAAVVCMHADALKTWQPYIDYFLYGDSDDDAPEEITIEGFSQRFDNELKKYVIEGYNALLGYEYLTNSNFEQEFGKYYIQLGKANENFEAFNNGIYVLIGGVIFLVIGAASVYHKPAPVQESTQPAGVFLEAEENHRLRGILGALFGALLGGVLWTAVGMLGYFSGWIGVLMAIFARTGYKLFSGKDDKFGTVISLVFCFIVVLPATFLAGGWDYYKSMNSFMAGSVTLFQALKEYPAYLTSSDSWGKMLTNVGLGYIFFFIGIAIDYRNNVLKK